MAILRPKPWQQTARTGPEQGIAVDALIMRRIIKKAENPFLVVGHEIMKDENLLRVVEHFASRGMPVFATAHAISKLREKGIEARSASITEVANNLRKKDFKINGKAPDLAIFIGVRYSTANDVFSLAKNFSEIKTASISRYYQPNASYSFANMTEEVFKEEIEKLIKE